MHLMNTWDTMYTFHSENSCYLIRTFDLFPIQEEYDAQLDVLAGKIQEAQLKMADPVTPVSMEALQEQLAQHEVHLNTIIYAK